MPAFAWEFAGLDGIAPLKSMGGCACAIGDDEFQKSTHESINFCSYLLHHRPSTQTRADNVRELLPVELLVLWPPQ